MTENQKPGFFATLFGFTPPPPKTPRPYRQFDGDIEGLPSPSKMLMPDHSDVIRRRERSLMHKKKTLCDGQSTGRPCKHYWHKVELISSDTPDHLKDGEHFRMCTYFGGSEPFIFEDGRVGMAVGSGENGDGCTAYEGHHRLTYIEKQENYSPLTPKEISAIERGEIKSFEDLARFQQEHAGDEEATAAPPAEQTVSVDDVLKAQD